MPDQAHGPGAGAVIGVDIDDEVRGKAGSMLIGTAAGTAVSLAPKKR